MLTYLPGSGKDRSPRGLLREPGVAFGRAAPAAAIDENGKASPELAAAIAALATRPSDPLRDLMAAASGGASFDQLLQGLGTNLGSTPANAIRLADMPTASVPIGSDMLLHDQFSLREGAADLTDSARRLALLRQDTAGFGGAGGLAELNLISPALPVSPSWF